MSQSSADHTCDISGENDTAAHSITGGDSVIVDMRSRKWKSIQATKVEGALKTGSKGEQELDRDVDFAVKHSFLGGQKAVESKEGVSGWEESSQKLSAYWGGWSDGKRDGLCMYRYVNGDVYQGRFKDGRREGLGSYVYTDGGMYQGYFQKNKREGKGRYHFTNGDSYEGDYRNDMRVGKGTYTSDNGNIYKGGWKNDQRHGEGKFEWTDGAMFKGTWNNNVKHGVGNFTTATGKVFEEKWKNGLLVYRVNAKEYEM